MCKLMVYKLLTCYFIWQIHLTICAEDVRNSFNHDILDQRTALDYLNFKQSIPVNDGVQITILAGIYISYINIDDINMECKVDVTFRQECYVNKSGSSERHYNKSESIARSNAPSGTSSMTLRPNGSQIHAETQTLRLPCPMDFTYFPFNGHLCYITIGAGGNYSTGKVTVKWQYDQVNISRTIKLKHFAFPSMGFGVCDSKGEDGCLVKVILLFKRLYKYHLLRIFFPCFMLVSISWLTLWLNSGQQLALRLSMTLMVILIMTILVGTYNGGIPSVGYIKAVDVWVTMCLAFSFVALVHSVFIHCIISTRHKQCPKNNVPEASASDDLEPSRESTEGRQKCHSRIVKKMFNYVFSATGFDLLMRIIYPVIFISLTVYFWSTVIKASRSLEEEFISQVEKPIFFGD